MTKQSTNKNDLTGYELYPINDRAIVRRDPTETVSKGGIILAEEAQARPQLGTVLAIGDGVLDDAGIFRATIIKPKDRILFSKHAGVECEMPNGETLLIMRESDVLGVFRKKK